MHGKGCLVKASNHALNARKRLPCHAFNARKNSFVKANIHALKVETRFSLGIVEITLPSGLYKYELFPPYVRQLSFVELSPV